jgi:hypothetical protein
MIRAEVADVGRLVQSPKGWTGARSLADGSPARSAVLPPFRQWLCAASLSLLTTTAMAGGPPPPPIYVSSTVICDAPSIQTAINAAPPGTEIRLVGAEFALASSLLVTNRRLRIVGGYPACGAPAPSGRTVLRANFDGNPVMLVTGNLVGALDLTLVDLDIVDADNPTENGGGIRVAGTGQVNLFGVDVRDNFAMAGGGVAVVAFGGEPLLLSLGRGTRIGGEVAGGNGAEFGGGIYCSDATLRLGHAAIVGNDASENGGGVNASNCMIETAIEPGATRIDLNSARRGGGMYATGVSTISLSGRPNQPISISGNAAINGAALRSGGGVFLAGEGVVFEGSGVRIDNNLAREQGGGIVVAGAKLQLVRDSNACAPGVDTCSSLSGNAVRNEAGVLAGEAAAALVGGTGAPQLVLSQTRIAGNASGGDILRAGDSARLELTSALIAGNSAGSSIMRISQSAELRMDFVTIAGNAHPAALMNHSSSAALGVQIRRSILMPAAGAVLVVGTGSTSFLCNNIAGGAHGGDSHAAGFVDAEAGNFRLRHNSQNLDRCAVDGTEPATDLGGRPRVVDDPNAPNAGGIVDRGAYEGSESTFSDSFEG